MRVIVNSSDLKVATNEVKGGISTAKLSPLYETVYLTTDGDKLYIVSQDDCIKVVSAVEANVEEQGSIRCNGALFCNVVAQLTTEKEVELSVDKGALVLTQGGAKIKVKEVSEFGAPVDVDWSGAIELNVNSSELSEGLSRCLVCVSKENSKPLLKGINFSIKGDKLRLAALDGYKISRYYVNCGYLSSDTMDATIYARCVPSIQSLCGKCESLKVKAKSNMVRFESENGYVEGAVINGNFFNVDEFFNRVNRVSTAIFDGKVLKQAISLACVSVDSTLYRLDLNFDFGNNILSIETQKEGAESKVEIPFEQNYGEDTSIAVNSSFLLDAIKSIKDEKVAIFIESQMKPIIVGSEENDNGFEILPIRRV